MSAASRPDSPGPTRAAGARLREMAGLGDSTGGHEHAIRHAPSELAPGVWRGAWIGFPALCSGALILVLRLARRQPIAQAVYGFVAVAVCAAVAARLGRAEGYFLPGILINAFYTGVGVLSVLVGHP